MPKDKILADLEKLPLELLSQVTLGMSITDIKTLSGTSHHMNELLNSDYIWEQLIIRDFGKPALEGLQELKMDANAKELYKFCAINVPELQNKIKVISSFSNRGHMYVTGKSYLNTDTANKLKNLQRWASAPIAEQIASYNLIYQQYNEVMTQIAEPNNRKKISDDDARGDNALEFAVRQHDAAMVEALLSDQRQNLNANVENGMTLLSLAASNGDIAILKLLLNDPRTNNANQERHKVHGALEKAVVHGRVDAVKFLLAHEKIQLKPSDYVNLAETANRYGKNETPILKLLEEDEKRRASLGAGSSGNTFKNN